MLESYTRFNKSVAFQFRCLSTSKRLRNKAQGWPALWLCGPTLGKRPKRFFNLEEVVARLLVQPEPQPLRGCELSGIFSQGRLSPNRANPGLWDITSSRLAEEASAKPAVPSTGGLLRIHMETGTRKGRERRVFQTPLLCSISLLLLNSVSSRPRPRSAARLSGTARDWVGNLVPALWKVPGLGDNLRLGLYVELPAGCTNTT